MSISIKLSDELVSEAKRYATVYSRSLPKQIEYWSRIGKIAEENPDLSFKFIQAILIGLQEHSDGNVTPFEFG
ncbi:TA system antitoxin ParD family protein [Bartonella queenslandensis]|uniref:TA system antitoxin ParD family protein n=1 Tax=Bartonella queenslandensis TaxID=481138 RepID=UPI001BA7345A|nr:hypothetical protein [Bartonella queenslandensis]